MKKSLMLCAGLCLAIAMASCSGSKESAYKKAYEKANRKAQLEVIHNWYQRNVKRYGFEYNFYPREDA